MKKAIVLLTLTMSTLAYSQDYFGVTPTVNTAGVMEIGKYIDFHETDDDASDFSGRLYVENSKLMYRFPGLTLSSTTETNYFVGGEYYMRYAYNIPSGYTDNGYRMGLNINSFVNTSDFKGTLKENIGVRIQTGAYTSSGTGTIETTYGLYLHCLEAGITTINNKFGIYQTGSVYKNYFAGSIGIGTTTPSTNKLAVIGTTYLSDKVSIGTTENDAMLTVGGKIEAEEIEVKDVGADFVFDEDYNLRSLGEVESFIKENGHLPEVAPASETKEGVNLGEFNQLLLQKVEELTLYIIEQEKRIQELETNNKY